MEKLMKFPLFATYNILAVLALPFVYLGLAGFMVKRYFEYR